MGLPSARILLPRGRATMVALVVLHPLVEEKVKEQLEAAKPEPVIEEVVSACTCSASSVVLLCSSPTFTSFSLSYILSFSYICPVFLPLAELRPFIYVSFLGPGEPRTT